MRSYSAIFILFMILAYVHINNCYLDANDKEKELFIRLFTMRRAEQLEAVKGLQVLGSEEKQKKMITIVVEKIFAVIIKSKEILESSGYIPGVSDFPEDETIRDALSNILENTAMLGDILLHLPDVSQPLLQANPNWAGTLGWSLTFVNQTSLLDANTVKLIDLVCQEMNYTAKRPDFINPYRKANKIKSEQKKEKIVSEERKKKKKLPRGPKLSSQQFGDL